MRGHLSAAAGDIRRRAHPLQELFFRGVAQRQAKGPIAIIWIKPVVARLQRQPGGHQQGLMTRA